MRSKLLAAIVDSAGEVPDTARKTLRNIISVDQITVNYLSIFYLVLTRYWAVCTVMFLVGAVFTTFTLGFMLLALSSTLAMWYCFQRYLYVCKCKQAFDELARNNDVPSYADSASGLRLRRWPPNGIVRRDSQRLSR